MKKKVVIFLSLVAAVALLFPIPQHLKDGGTVEYRAILYSFKNVHRLSPGLEPAKEYQEGTVIAILGIEIFNYVQ